MSISFKPQKGVVNPSKREQMRALILQGLPMETIAQHLGYANGHSAYVMAYKWGFHTLRVESNTYKQD